MALINKTPPDLKKLDKSSKADITRALDKLDKEHRESIKYLEPDAKIIEGLHNEIEALEKKIKWLDNKKQSELKDFQDKMDSAVAITFEMPNGFTISHAQTRKVEIISIRDFMKWLKENCETSEVLSFLEEAISVTELKKFANKKCDEQVRKGIFFPEISGLEIREATFRRLTTFYKKDKV